MGTLRGHFYEFELNHFEGRYFSSNGYNVAIVACVTPEVDWAAYIGGDCSEREKQTLDFVVAYGSKLSEEDARHFFLNFDLSYRY